MKHYRLSVTQEFVPIHTHSIWELCSSHRVVWHYNFATNQSQIHKVDCLGDYVPGGLTCKIENCVVDPNDFDRELSKIGYTRARIEKELHDAQLVE